MNMAEERYLLSLMNLFSYLEALPSSRCVVEGEAVVNARHIITCGILDKTDYYIKVFALCLKTSALQDKPHEINGKFNIVNSKIKAEEFICTCKAGLSQRCKHVAAVLILCTRQNVLSFPILSSTDIKCYLSRSKAAENYSPAPLLEHECFVGKVSPKVNPKKKLDGDYIVSLFTANLPNSALAKHVKRRKIDLHNNNNDLPMQSFEKHLLTLLENAANTILKKIDQIKIASECCKKTLKAISDVDTAAVATVTKNNRKEWFKERQFRITGSRCYSVFTYSLDDWESKAKKYFWPKSFTSKYTDHGQKFEGTARTIYCSRNKCEVFQTGLIICKYLPWLAYSPDGIIFEDNKPTKLLEIKCPYIGKDNSATNCIDSCYYLISKDNRILLKKNHQYCAQVQLGLAILNLKECDFIIFASHDSTFINITVPFDEEYCYNLVTTLQNNYIKMLHVLCENNNV